MLQNEIFYTIITDKNGNEYKVSEDELKYSFANCLKELRKYKGYTLKQVADGTGIPIPTIQRYESGENTPSVIQAYKFSHFYKLNLSDMFLVGYLNEDEREKIFDENLN